MGTKSIHYVVHASTMPCTLRQARPEALRALAEGGEMGGRPLQALAAIDQGRVILCVRLGDAAARVARDAVLGSARKVEVRGGGLGVC